MRTAEQQRQYRLSVSAERAFMKAERARMKASLEEIDALLEGKEKELSLQLRAIARRGLGIS